jgi:RNA polymerase sigma-70 factor (ECF subfamily)
MDHQTTIPAFTLEDIAPGEQARLVRLCAYLSGDPAAADDLAQETLLEAWRNRHKLVEPQGYSAWLSAIARNVCLRWKRRRGRELGHYADPPSSESTIPFNLDALPGVEPDLEVELDRDELVTLLDRALALLPADTRAALIEKYIAGSPLAEIAARLGLAENTIAVRLHRGKLALRKLLTTHLRSEAMELGLIPTGPGSASVPSPSRSLTSPARRVAGSTPNRWADRLSASPKDGSSGAIILVFVPYLTAK